MSNVQLLITIVALASLLGGQTWLIMLFVNKIDTKIDALDSKIETLGRSIHADFIEHLRREHKLGQ